MGWRVESEKFGIRSAELLGEEALWKVVLAL